MRIKTNPKDLLTGLSYIVKVTKTRTAKPILDCVRILFRDDYKIVLEATDLEISLRWAIDDITTIQNEGRKPIVVNSHKLYAIIKKLKKLESVELWTEDNRLYIKGEKTEFYLVLDDPEEFPNIPDTYVDNSLEISDKDFVKKMKKTLFAVAKDMSCFAYNGLLMEVSPDGELSTVATDGLRLAISGAPHIYKKPEKSFIVPVKAINLVLGMLKKPKGDSLYIDTHKNMVRVTCIGKFEVFVRPLEGDFPMYREVIPEYKEEETLNLNIKRSELIDAIDTCGLTAGHEVRAVDIELTKVFNIVVSSNQGGIGGTRIEVPVLHGDVPAVRETDEVIDGKKADLKEDYWYKNELTMNPDFLLDFLKVLESEHVEIYLKDVLSPIKVEGMDIADTECYYICMPICGK